MRQSALNRPARCCCWSGVVVSFHGHYHQHVEQNCEGTSDAVNDDSDDIINLQWHICCVAFCAGHLCSVCKIYSCPVNLSGRFYICYDMNAVFSRFGVPKFST